MEARSGGRGRFDLRPVQIAPNVMPNAEGSAEIIWGGTRVFCSASVEESVPRWLNSSGRGWITAEYNMLPRAAVSRARRDRVMSSGRTKEISRLIGRALRACCALDTLGERQIHIDCDVVQADGGTRVASVTGGFVALALAVEKLLKNNTIKKNPLLFYVSGVSTAVWNETVILDPDFLEDQSCSTDMNVIVSSRGGLIEVQAAAEKSPFTKEEFDEMIFAAKKACGQLFQKQSEAMSGFFELDLQSGQKQPAL